MGALMGICRTEKLARRVMAMRNAVLWLAMGALAAMAMGQGAAPAFEVAAVRACARTVGPDYNNQVTYSATGFTGRNVTLKRLVAEAYELQMSQVKGPGWLEQVEYDVDARATGATARAAMAGMLKGLLAERFKLAAHSEAREMRVYALVAAPGGAKIHALKDGEAVAAQGGFHFHGTLQRFADLLTVQLSIPAPMNPNEPVRAGGPQIPVVDRTGLAGDFDFSVKMQPEMGTDMFTAWRRALGEQLGLSLERRKESLAVLVVDGAERVPTAN